jgi:CubicO group peptidase (beta-lactamase class C family)
MQNRLLKIGFVFVIMFFLIGTSMIPGKALSNTNTDGGHEKQENIPDKAFDRQIAFLMKLAHMPSLSVCIIKNNTIWWSKGYVNSHKNFGRTITNQTIYMIGSITKTITATAIMQLNETRQINLDDNVNTYLPFHLYNPHHPYETITVRMLLGHRSGLQTAGNKFDIYFYWLGYPFSWLSEYLDPKGHIYDPRVWSKDQPDKKFHYANIGFELLGYIIEQVTHQSYEEYCKHNIFLPLNMTNTSFRFSDYPITMLAKPSMWIGGRYINLPDHDAGIIASGGLRTNVLDLSHFLIAQMNNGTYNGHQILTQKSIEIMHTVYSYNIKNSYNPKKRVDYGLGWAIWHSPDAEIYEGHIGSVYGGQALMKYRVSDKTGVILLWNQCVEKPPRPIEKRIAIPFIEQLVFEK